MKLDLDPIRERNSEFKFRQKVRNNRVYITITPKNSKSVDYLDLIRIARKEFTGIRITSGSGMGITGVLPTLLELIESPPESRIAATLREKYKVYRPS